MPALSEEPKRASKRVRIGVVDGGQSQSGQHVIAGLRKLEGLPGRPPLGTLLLAQDPRSLNRYTLVPCASLKMCRPIKKCRPKPENASSILLIAFAGQHVIAGLRKLEGLPGRPPTVTLLLAQDLRSLNKYPLAYCAPHHCLRGPLAALTLMHLPVVGSGPLQPTCACCKTAGWPHWLLLLSTPSCECRH